MTKNNQTRVLIILGMHRSGTSALTGSLEAAGVFLGDVNEHSEDNQKGNRESRTVMTLHDDLLERNNASWDKPVHNLKWYPIHRSMRDLVIQSYVNKPIWGFKDPRSLLAIRGWLDVLPHAELIGIFRHPFLVAQSLNARNGIAHDEGLALWLSYNRVVLWLYENEMNFPIVEFSTDAQKFVHQLSMLGDVLQLNGDTQAFFEPSLRKESPPDLTGVQHAPAALNVYRRLQSISLLER